VASADPIGLEASVSDPDSIGSGDSDPDPGRGRLNWMKKFMLEESSYRVRRHI
jgi:hypothetical protein